MCMTTCYNAKVKQVEYTKLPNNVTRFQILWFHRLFQCFPSAVIQKEHKVRDRVKMTWEWATHCKMEKKKHNEKPNKVQNTGPTIRHRSTVKHWQEQELNCGATFRLRARRSSQGDYYLIPERTEPTEPRGVQRSTVGKQPDRGNQGQRRNNMKCQRSSKQREQISRRTWKHISSRHRANDQRRNSCRPLPLIHAASGACQLEG